MAQADIGDKINKAISRKILKLDYKKKRHPEMEAELKGLWGPLLVISGKLLCLIVLIPTAILEGVYEGCKHMISVLEKGM